MNRTGSLLKSSCKLGALAVTFGFLQIQAKAAEDPQKQILAPVDPLRKAIEAIEKYVEVQGPPVIVILRKAPDPNLTVEDIRLLAEASFVVVKGQDIQEVIQFDESELECLSVRKKIVLDNLPEGGNVDVVGLLEESCK